MNHAPRPSLAPSDDPDASRVRPVVAAPRAEMVEAGDAEMDPDWWSESADGRCSESAALFAASQAAPLTVV